MIEQKTEIPGIYKASEGILINKDETSLLRYKREKSTIKKIRSLENDLALIKNDISEIKTLLKGIIG
jgi:hypothetical protein